MVGKRRIISSLFIILFFSQVLYAYTPDEANQFYVDKNWSKTAESYSELIKTDTENGSYWFRLGLALHNLERYEEAIDAYEKCEAFEFVRGITRYNMACAYSLKGETDIAFDWLALSLEAGFDKVELIEDDSDLDNLRSDIRYDKFMDHVERLASPCTFDERYNQLDFWLGEWVVFDQAGVKAGENTITRDLRGCVITENWISSASSFMGRSVNFFDPETKRWIQIWNDNAGQILRYEAEFKDGAMHYTGRNITMDGKTEISRMTLTPLENGQVEQLIEHSKDNGTSWYVYFHGTYIPKDKMKSGCAK